MSRKRQRRELEDPHLKEYNAIGSKRPHYDLRYGQVRECCSLPQYDKQPGQHKYHLRPFEHRKLDSYIGSKQSIHTVTSSNQKVYTASNQNFVIANGSSDVRRNAHSYSLNGYVARCSNSSTASGRQRTIQALKKGTGPMSGTGHRKKDKVSKTRQFAV